MQQVRKTVLVTVGGLVLGLALHFTAIYLRDHGPTGQGWSLRGNGALIVLPLGVALLVIGEVLVGAWRAWVGMVALPITLFVGMFVLAGSI